MRFQLRTALRQVVLVGCGGTGSAWAAILGRILYDRRRRGHDLPEVLLVDPDIIEERNLGRQGFAPCQLGGYKAETLARGLNAALGLSIARAIVAFDAKKHLAPYGALLCGAVDNHEARRAMAKARPAVWVDAGNHFASGQVVVGTTGDGEEMRRVLNEGSEEIHSLPNGALVHPDLLEPVKEPELSCAQLLESGSQHLLVNEAIANVAGFYAYQLLNRQPLDTWLTYLSLEGGISARSVPVARDEILARI